MKKLIALIFPLAALLLLSGCTQGQPAKSTGNTMDSPKPTANVKHADTIPDFTVTDLNGNTFDTKALRGKILIINFWATWCGPCRSEMPDIEKIYEKLGDDVAFIAIDVPEEGMTVDMMKAFLKENKLTFPVGLDDGKNSVADLYKVEAIPTTLFVDPAGVLFFKQVGAFSSGEEILNKVDEIRKDFKG